jgi:hypothetical protein
VTVTTGDIIAFVIGFLGFLGTLSMALLNVKVTAAMALMKAEFVSELSKVRVEVVNLKAEFLKDNSRLYETITNGFMNRRESEQMHGENKSRLDRIEHKITSMEERFPA